jgi:hypothetical protein
MALSVLLAMPLKGPWVQNDLERKLLELYDFCPDAAPRFPPTVRVKI